MSLCRNGGVEGAGMHNMLKSLIPLLSSIALSSFIPSVWGQKIPADVPLCDLAGHPKPFDGETIRVRGRLNVYFEDFTLAVGDCNTSQYIWLAFGGDVPGIVASTVNDIFRKPGVDLKVNGVSYAIKKDENFHRLYALIAAREGNKPAYRVTATLTGAFLAGEERKSPNGKSFYSGYGHLGCCSLFIITQISDVESVPPANLNLHGTVSGPDGRPAEGFVVVDEILGGSPRERQRTITNKTGGFEFSDSGPLLRFEDPRYRPLALPVKPGGSPVDIRLEDAKRSDWTIPSCGQSGDSSGRIGFSALFVLPMGLESELLDDEGWHCYFVYPRGGDPSEADLTISTWADEQTDEPTTFVDSNRSEQRWIKDSGGNVVGIDSRGRLKGGEHWRTARFLDHDSIGYSVKSGTRAGSYDMIIDSACISKR
jgi:hypothetical protein